MQTHFLSLIDGKKNSRPIAEQFNFSVKKVNSGEKLEIPVHHQMIMNGMLIVDGQLDVFGEIIFLDLEDSDTQQVIPPADPENFSHARVISGETKVVPQWQQMNLYGKIEVLGQLNLLGSMNLAELHQEQPEPEEFVTEDNFSYKKIVANTSIKVRTNEQMVVCGNIEVLGQLNLLGELALISAEVETDEEDDFLPPYKIENGEIFKIANNKIMFLPRSLINLGQLNVFGELALGGM
jgi:hypothetical protein